ncbi:hypothetical protein ACO0K0_10785 [Undibacterium sp. SXout11W]|uniref:hypothetical protein n=1 Tax=Undibacterium sp. SXout11W TaxID=3413050 RepID=UPI003BF2D1D1
MKKAIFRKPAATIISVAISAAILAACGGGGSSASNDTSNTSPATPTTSTTNVIAGTVFAAATSGATVKLFAADANGNPTGNALGTASTDANGNFSIALTSQPSGPVVLVSSGGSYSSEADATTQTGATFQVLVANVPAGNSSAHLNPLTSAITARASNLLSSAPATSPAAALSSATSSVQTLLGLSDISTSAVTIAPNTNATSGDAWLLSALAGTLEQLRTNSGLNSGAIYQALMDDISDGKLDGLKNGKSIAIGTSGQTLQSSLFTTQLSGAANTYGNTHATYQSATGKISTALQNSAQAIGLQVGSSGSISLYQTQSTGTQLYFAARTDGLVKLDMSVPSAPVATKLAAINQSLLSGANPSGVSFGSIDGMVINPTPITINGSSKVYGLVYSYWSSTVASVNLTDGVVVGTLNLPISKATLFSGAKAYVAGGIADGSHSLIWLATSEGMIGVNPSNLNLPVTKIAQPVGTQINENIGGDTANGIIFSPDYMGAGIVVFNLIEGKSYVMDKATWQALYANTGFTGYLEMDGATLDTQYKLAIITPEGSNTIGLLGYNIPSGATGATGTFASKLFMSYAVPNQALNFASYTGATVDPVSHTALFVGEGRGLGVGVLDDPSNANWKGFSAFVNANSSYRFEPHDPHTLGTFNISGKPYGFLLNGAYGSYKVAIIDLNAMLAAPTTGGWTNTDPFTDPKITTLIGY